MDELLVGILTQIRLKLAEKNRGLFKVGAHHKAVGRRLMSRSSSGGGGIGSGVRRKAVRVKGILDKVLGGDSKSKSCDDLHVL